jgi:hypothetical protein
MTPDLVPIPTPTGDRLLTPEDAAARLGVGVRWLYRHADQFTFTRRLTRKCLRFAERGLTAYIEKGRL